MKEYQYHGYIIKQARRRIEGIVYEVYKGEELIGWDNREKIAQNIIDWDIRRCNEYE